MSDINKIKNNFFENIKAGGVFPDSDGQTVSAEKLLTMVIAIGDEILPEILDRGKLVYMIKTFRDNCKFLLIDLYNEGPILTHMMVYNIPVTCEIEKDETKHPTLKMIENLFQDENLEEYCYCMANNDDNDYITYFNCVVDLYKYRTLKKHKDENKNK